MKALEIIQRLNFCECGNPDDAYDALKEALDAHNCVGEITDKSWAKRCEKAKAWEEKLGEKPAHLLRYFIDAAGLLEHGGSVGGSWLSEDGKLLLEFFNDFGTDPDDWE